MIIKTQKSLHVYWFMDESAEVLRFRGIQKALVKHFDGDPMCANESRAMRLPGFMHCKKEIPVEVTCVCFHPERKYSQDQLAAVLPEINSDFFELPQKQPVAYGTEKGLSNLYFDLFELIHGRQAFFYHPAKIRLASSS